MLDAQSKSPVSKTSGWHQGQLSFSFFQIQSNEYQGLPGSDTVEPYLLLIKKGPNLFFSSYFKSAKCPNTVFFMIYLATVRKTEKFSK